MATVRSGIRESGPPATSRKMTEKMGNDFTAPFPSEKGARPMLPDALLHHPAIVLQWGVVLGIALTAALFDLRQGRIPNTLVVVTFVAAVVFNAAVVGWMALIDGLLGSAILSVPYILLFLYAGGGAGDAKLMMALGMWLGGINAVLALVMIAVTGIFMAILVAIYRRQALAVFTNLKHITKHAFAEIIILRNFKDMKLIPQGTQTQHTLPYAVAAYLGLCIAACGLLLWGM